MKQLEFDFIQQKRSSIAASEMSFRLDEDTYVYGKRKDYLLNLIPFRLGWKVIHWPSEIKWWIKCKYQKIRYGVSDDDIFSLYYNIASFILPRLKYFKKKGKVGIPACLLPKNYHSLGDFEKNMVEKASEKEWDNILDEMIFAFEYIIDADKFCKIPEILSERYKKLDFNSEKTLEENQAWADYMDLSDQLNERKEKGFILFAKYFDCLWI